MKIKAILGAILLAGFTFFIGCTGCGSNSEPTTDTTENPAVDSTEVETDTVTVESL
jgi:hypothetical protein